MDGKCTMCGHHGPVMVKFGIVWCADLDACIQRQVAASPNDHDLQALVKSRAEWNRKREEARYNGQGISSVR